MLQFILIVDPTFYEIWYSKKERKIVRIFFRTTVQHETRAQNQFVCKFRRRMYIKYQFSLYKFYLLLPR